MHVWILIFFKIFYKFIYKIFFILAVCFFIIPQGLADNMTSKIIMIKILPKNTNIWIRGSRENDITYFNVKNKPEKISKFMDTLILTYNNYFHIKIKNIDVNFTKSNIFINNIPMNNEINVVVDESGNVRLGNFIRSFD
jgi:hypothetical protein